MRYFIFNFPEPNSFYAESAQKLFSLIVGYSILILAIVVTIIAFIISNNSQSYNISTNSKENWILEGIFVVFPFLIITLLVYSSPTFLDNLNEIREPEVIAKKADLLISSSLVPSVIKTNTNFKQFCLKLLKKKSNANVIFKNICRKLVRLKIKFNNNLILPLLLFTMA